MNKKIPRNIAIAVSVLLLIACTWGYWRLMDSGFCVSKMRYLDDRELIESAIRHELFQMNLETNPEAIASFLQANKSCCGVDRHPDWRRTWFDTLTGFNYAEVTLNFEKKQTEASQGMRRFYKSLVAVDACGPALKSIGTDTATLENYP
ncbi:hypothetical protein [Variovorax paradoxus]|uniref:hypothetical protein n=1 Tax=Variovorax paradoxus TaxID=34073 RepID=UPI0024806F82|nr:hypothetical protein [Variovorax paradoxus]WGT65758.1 hypothetical protein QHG62_10580 [Variovorax paradoxus]